MRRRFTANLSATNTLIYGKQNSQFLFGSGSIFTKSSSNMPSKRNRESEKDRGEDSREGRRRKRSCRRRSRRTSRRRHEVRRRRSRSNSLTSRSNDPKRRRLRSREDDCGEMLARVPESRARAEITVSGTGTATATGGTRARGRPVVDTPAPSASDRTTHTSHRKPTISHRFRDRERHDSRPRRRRPKRGYKCRDEDLSRSRRRRSERSSRFRGGRRNQSRRRRGRISRNPNRRSSCSSSRSGSLSSAISWSRHGSRKRGGSDRGIICRQKRAEDVDRRRSKRSRSRSSSLSDSDSAISRIRSKASDVERRGIGKDGRRKSNYRSRGRSPKRICRRDRCEPNHSESHHSTSSMRVHRGGGHRGRSGLRGAGANQNERHSRRRAEDEPLLLLGESNNAAGAGAAPPGVFAGKEGFGAARRGGQGQGQQRHDSDHDQQRNDTTSATSGAGPAAGGGTVSSSSSTSWGAGLAVQLQLQVHHAQHLVMNSPAIFKRTTKASTNKTADHDVADADPEPRICDVDNAGGGRGTGRRAPDLRSRSGTRASCGSVAAPADVVQKVARQNAAPRAVVGVPAAAPRKLCSKCQRLKKQDLFTKKMWKKCDAERLCEDCNYSPFYYNVYHSPTDSEVEEPGASAKFVSQKHWRRIKKQYDYKQLLRCSVCERFKPTRPGAGRRYCGNRRGNETETGVNIWTNAELKKAQWTSECEPPPVLCQVCIWTTQNPNSHVRYYYDETDSDELSGAGRESLRVDRAGGETSGFRRTRKDGKVKKKCAGRCGAGVKPEERGRWKCLDKYTTKEWEKTGGQCIKCQECQGLPHLAEDDKTDSSEEEGASNGLSKEQAEAKQVGAGGSGSRLPGRCFIGKTAQSCALPLTPEQALSLISEIDPEPFDENTFRRDAGLRELLKQQTHAKELERDAICLCDTVGDVWRCAVRDWEGTGQVEEKTFHPPPDSDAEGVATGHSNLFRAQVRVNLHAVDGSGRYESTPRNELAFPSGEMTQDGESCGGAPATAFSAYGESREDARTLARLQALLTITNTNRDAAKFFDYKGINVIKNLFRIPRRTKTTSAHGPGGVAPSSDSNQHALNAEEEASEMPAPADFGAVLRLIEERKLPSIFWRPLFAHLLAPGATEDDIDKVTDAMLQSGQELPLEYYISFLERVTFVENGGSHESALKSVLGRLHPGEAQSFGAIHPGLSVKPLRTWLGRSSACCPDSEHARMLVEGHLLEFARGVTDKTVAAGGKCRIKIDAQLLRNQLETRPGDALKSFAIECHDLRPPSPLRLPRARDLLRITQPRATFGEQPLTFYALAASATLQEPADTTPETGPKRVEKVLCVWCEPVLFDYTTAGKLRSGAADVVVELVEDCLWHVARDGLHAVEMLFCGGESITRVPESPVLQRILLPRGRGGDGPPGGADGPPGISSPSGSSARRSGSSVVPALAQESAEENEGEERRRDHQGDAFAKQLKGEEERPTLGHCVKGAAEVPFEVKQESQLLAPDENTAGIQFKGQQTEMEREPRDKLEEMKLQGTQVRFAELVEQGTPVVLAQGPPATGKTAACCVVVKYLLERAPTQIRMIAESNDAVNAFSESLRRRGLCHIRFEGTKVGPKRDWKSSAALHVYEQRDLWREWLSAAPKLPGEGGARLLVARNNAAELLEKIVTSCEEWERRNLAEREAAARQRADGEWPRHRNDDGLGLELSQDIARHRLADSLSKDLKSFIKVAAGELRRPVLTTCARCGEDDLVKPCDVDAPGTGTAAAVPVILIVDEAAKSTEIVPLTALRHYHRASQLILLGDHKQLPPFLLSAEARGRGFGMSLFKRLVPEKHLTHGEGHGQRGGASISSDGGGREQLVNHDAVVPLVTFSKQFRMHSSLSHFWAKVFYGGCVDNGKADAEYPPVHGFPWVAYDAESCRPARRGDHFRAAFVDLDRLRDDKNQKALEKPGRGFENFLEALWIIQHVLRPVVQANANHTSSDAGSSSSGATTTSPAAEADPLPHPSLTTVCVLAGYVAQVELLRRMVSEECGDLLESTSSNGSSFESRTPGVRVEVRSIDTYQGKEADLVVLSFVRTGAQGFLQDEARRNVALTRARRGFIAVGSGTAMRGSEKPERGAVGSAEHEAGTWRKWREWVANNRADFRHYEIEKWVAARPSALGLGKITVHPDDREPSFVLVDGGNALHWPRNARESLGLQDNRRGGDEELPPRDLLLHKGAKVLLSLLDAIRSDFEKKRPLRHGDNRHGAAPVPSSHCCIQVHAYGPLLDDIAKCLPGFGFAARVVEKGAHIVRCVPGMDQDLPLLNDAHSLTERHPEGAIAIISNDNFRDHSGITPALVLDGVSRRGFDVGTDGEVMLHEPLPLEGLGAAAAASTTRAPRNATPPQVPEEGARSSASPAAPEMLSDDERLERSVRAVVAWTQRQRKPASASAKIAKILKEDYPVEEGGVVARKYDILYDAKSRGRGAEILMFGELELQVGEGGEARRFEVAIPYSKFYTKRELQTLFARVSS